MATLYTHTHTQKHIYLHIYLVVQNDSRRKQNVDEQVEISEKSFVHHWSLVTRESLWPPKKEASAAEAVSVTREFKIGKG